MASFGVSVGDFIASAKLAREIYLNGFTEAQAAHVKYANFRQDINSLENCLNQLVSIINNARSQPAQRPWHSDAHSSSSAMRVLPEVVGDFSLTLKECEKLLRSHAKLQYGHSSVFTNLAFWSSGADRDIDSLRSRVQFHVTKIALVSKPFETQLLLEIRNEVRGLREDLARWTGTSTSGVDAEQSKVDSGSFLRDLEIPEAISSRFENALRTNPPSAYAADSGIPVKEGFDALVYNFAKSTVEFNAMPSLGQKSPEGLQYLNLLKSVWLLLQIKQSSHYTGIASGSLWVDYMRELEGDIRSQIRRFDDERMVKPPYEAYASLPEPCFSVWVQEKPLTQPSDLAEQGPLEEKILELPLTQESNSGSRSSSLTVLRRSNVEYRLVTTTKQKDNPMFHSEESCPVNMGSAKFIPAYATDVENFNASNNVALCNDQGQFAQWYTLASLEDVWQLQRALTGYRVHYPMPQIDWLLDTGDEGQGSLQLWQHRPLRAEVPAATELDRIDRSATTGSQSPPGKSHGFLNLTSPVAARRPSTPIAVHQRSGSGSSSVTVRNGLSGQSTMVQSENSAAVSCSTLATHGSVTSRVSGPRSPGVELVRPEVPVLILFTKSQNIHTFVHLPLDAHIFVNPKACDCRKPRNSCKRIVLESSERKFKLRKLVASTDNKDDLFSWDLATFRLPRPAKYQNVKVVEKVRTFRLSFESVEAKEEFLLELQELENWRTVERNRYEEARVEARRKGSR